MRRSGFSAAALGLTCARTWIKGTNVGSLWQHRAAAPGGGSRIVLARAENSLQTAAIGGQGAGRVWLFLTTDDFDRDRARLLAAGARFEEEPRHESYGIVAVWRDPFGNRWDLIQPHAQNS
jgi:uncharacterized glyoxalase superfamily protein PhnB